MENASKALIIAASVLIGVMILSLGVYLVVAFGHSAAEINEQNRENQIAQFNSQFTQYQDKSVTIYDILTVANLAKQNNEDYSLTQADAGTNDDTNSYYITVNADLYSGKKYNFETICGSYNVDYNTEINTATHELYKYKCKVYVSNKTERVYKVEYTK
jgi:lipopolysaccharide export LptBFGC system permease protein LptF